MTPARDDHRPRPALPRLVAAHPWFARVLFGDWSQTVRDPLDVLRGLFLIGAVIALAEGDRSAALRLLVTFGAVLIARRLALPRLFDLAFIAGMAFQGGGNAFGLFDNVDHYDKVVHFVLPTAMAPLIYIALVRLEAVPDLAERKRSHHYVGIFIIAVTAGFSVGAVYEIYEYIAVTWFGAHLHIGYRDTIGDLADDLLGSLCGAALLVAWGLRGWATTRRVPAGRLDDGSRGRRRRSGAPRPNVERDVVGSRS